jgi:hypothetical protein
MIYINKASRPLRKVSKAGWKECLFADWEDTQLSNVAGRKKSTGGSKFNAVLTIQTM